MISFWKRLGEHVLLTAITLVLTIGAIFGGVALWEFIQPTPSYQSSDENYEYLSTHEDISKYLEIKNQRITPSTDNFVVTATVVNLSDSEWLNINVDILYYVEDIQMGECNAYFTMEQIKPHTEHAISVECNKLSANNLPTKFSYKLIFTRASRDIR